MELQLGCATMTHLEHLNTIVIIALPLYFVKDDLRYLVTRRLIEE